MTKEEKKKYMDEYNARIENLIPGYKIIDIDDSPKKGKKNNYSDYFIDSISFSLY